MGRNVRRYRLWLTLSKDLYDALRAEAKAEDRPMTYLVRRAVCDVYLKGNGAPAKQPKK